MTLSLQQPEALAFDVAHKLSAHKAGVVVTVQRSWGETLFVMWAIGTDGKINSHQLDAHCTDASRLSAHVSGFIENHRRAWASHAA